MDETQNTLWRVQNGVLDNVKPKVSYQIFSQLNFVDNNNNNNNQTTFIFSLDLSALLFDQIIVLHVGTNNVQNSSDEIADGISEIVKCIREKLPDVYIVLPVMCSCVLFMRMLC